VASWDEYRQVSRAGRGIALGAKQRKRLWAVFERARGSLADRGLVTWAGLCHDVARWLDRLDGARFRHVIADEVQDFGLPELRLVRALARGGDDDLFLVGDAGQRIYESRAAWALAGISVRGRSSRLRVNYRTTEQIRRFAERLIAREREPEDDDDPAPTISKLSGVEPELHGFASVDEEILAVAQWIREAIERGHEPRDIAVFARASSVLDERAAAAVEAAGLSWAMLRDEEVLDAGRVALGTMHRAKGLEFEVVVVMGCERGLVPLAKALREVVDPADREGVIAQERSLLYVASTRARERVLLTWTGVRSELLAALGTDQG
jgi:superfamily I DNA/RNA helicase